jgi:hypothetical protein
LAGDLVDEGYSGRPAEAVREQRRASLHRGLLRQGEADEHLASCLDEVPEEPECLRYLAAVLAADRASVLDARLRKLKDLDETMATSIETALDSGDAASARALLDAVRRVRPASPILARFAGRIPAVQR